mmetsp:Transcript_10053/g.40982  ORF Transcript_10053/g.40982 Transcript_10053/m.40982 type:complete len:254 (+) Transcript_10053:1415-2176(+)
MARAGVRPARAAVRPAAERGHRAAGPLGRAGPGPAAVRAGRRGALDLCRAAGRGQPDCERAGPGPGRGARPSGAAARHQHAAAGGLLVRGHQGRGDRGGDDAAAARRRAGQGHRQGRGDPRAVRCRAGRRARRRPGPASGAAPRRALPQHRARRPGGAHRAPARHVHERGHRERRLRADRLHLRHHGPAQGHDAFPPRCAGHLPLLAAALPAGHGAGRLHRQPAAGLHLRPGRPAAVPDECGRLGRAAGKGQP